MVEVEEREEGGRSLDFRWGGGRGRQPAELTRGVGDSPAREGRGTRDEKAVRRRSGQSAALRRPGSDKESLYMSRPGISHQPAVSIY
jgi:hypothetical protein